MYILYRLKIQKKYLQQSWLESNNNGNTFQSSAEFWGYLHMFPKLKAVLKKTNLENFVKSPSYAILIRCTSAYEGMT